MESVRLPGRAYPSSLNVQRTRADVLDMSVGLVDFDDVADLDRPLDQQYQPTDEIVDDVLAAKADADCQTSSQHRERRQGDPHRSQGEQKEQREQQVERQALERERGTRIHRECSRQ